MLIASENSAPDFAPAPAGVWPGRLYRLIDLGTVRGEYQGKPTSSRKVLFSFELLDPEAITEDGKPAAVHRRFTLSLGKKSALRAFLEAWRGRPFSEDELRGFDLTRVMGIGALLNITHEIKGDRTFAQIQSISPPPKGYTIPPAVNPPLTFDCDNPDPDVLEQLGKGLREQIEASPEYQAWFNGPANVPDLPEPDDDFPFADDNTSF